MNPWRLAGVVPLAPAVLALAACSVGIAPGTPVSVAAQRIAPWESHEACAAGEVGDRIEFRFESTRPVDFGLSYTQAGAVVIPVSRTKVKVDSGIYEVQIPARYCLSWQAGPEGAFVDYHLRVRRAD